MRQFDVQTEKKTELVNITEQVREAVRGNGGGGSAALVYVPHTTAAVTINENIDPDLVDDLERVWTDELSPHGAVVDILADRDLPELLRGLVGTGGKRIRPSMCLWGWVVAGGRRDDLRKYLGERGIGTQIHYPVPIHLQQSAEFLGYRKGDMPVTERVASEVLSLPMFAELTDDQLARVADSVRSFMKGN